VTVRSIDTGSEEQTSSAGEALAAALVPGDVLLLDGELGAGKTAFVRGLARGLGLQPDEVTSPTFTLIQEYRVPGSSVVLYHADLYRLTPREVDDLGLGELSEDGILAVEWPDRWTDPPASVYRVNIRHLGENLRSITVSLPQTQQEKGRRGETT
jgi:tRNA threonylcarbamoyladenosine biosynthesis protein TsaE